MLYHFLSSKRIRGYPTGHHGYMTSLRRCDCYLYSSRAGCHNRFHILHQLNEAATVEQAVVALRGELRESSVLGEYRAPAPSATPWRRSGRPAPCRVPGVRAPSLGPVRQRYTLLGRALPARHVRLRR